MEKNIFLVELSEEELVELREFYKEKVSYVYTLIDVALRWKKFGFSNVLSITSPNGNWRKDGSIIAFLEVGFYTGIYVYSLDNNLTDIRAAFLEHINKFDSTKPLIFYNVIENHTKAVFEMLKMVKKWKLTKSYENLFFRIEKEEAIAFDNTNFLSKNNLYLSELEEKHSSQINEVWPHKFPTSEKFVELKIRLNGGLGLFLKENNELVSWILQGPLGHLNLLQTEENYKGRGYAGVVVKALAKKIAESGHVPVATVLSKNMASVNLFKRLEFRVTEKSYFLELLPVCYDQSS